MYLKENQMYQPFLNQSYTLQQGLKVVKSS